MADVALQGVSLCNLTRSYLGVGILAWDLLPLVTSRPPKKTDLESFRDGLSIESRAGCFNINLLGLIEDHFAGSRSPFFRGS